VYYEEKAHRQAIEWSLRKQDQLNSLLIHQHRKEYGDGGFLVNP